MSAGDLGPLQATLGVDCTGLRTAEREMQQFGASATSSFAQAEGAAAAFGGQLMALVGISLSVAAAVSKISSVIESINDTNIKHIANAAMILSRQTIEGIGAQKAAFTDYMEYSKSMYKALNAEAAYHFVAGKQLQETFNAFIKKGISVREDEVKAIGTITDAMSVLHNGQMHGMTAQMEINGVLMAQGGYRFKLAAMLKQQVEAEGGDWKKVVAEVKKAGNEIQWMAERLKGFSVAQDEITKQLQTQRSTYDTLMGQIGKAGLAGMYADIVVVLTEINDYLTIQKDDLIVQIKEGWKSIRTAIKGAAEELAEFNKNHPVMVGISGQFLKLGSYAVGASIGILAIKGAWNTIISALSSTIGLVGKAFTMVGGVVTGVVSEFMVAMGLASTTGTAMGTATSLGAAVSVAAIITMAGHIAARLTYMLVGWIATWDIAGTSVGDYCSLAYLYVKEFGVNIVSAMQNTCLDIESRWEQMTFVMKKGLLDVLSSAQNIPVVGGVFAGFANDSKNLEESHKVRLKQIEEHRQALKNQNDEIRKNIENQRQDIDIKRVQVKGFVGPPEPLKIPPRSPAAPDKAGKGGKGGGADSEQNRLNSLFDTLIKEQASLTGGKAAEIYANLDKTLAQIQGKAEHRAVDQAEVEVLAKSVAAKKIEKLTEDTSLWIAKEYGDQTAALNAEEAEKLKTVRYTGEMSYQDQVKLWNLQQGIREVYTKKRIANDIEIRGTELNSQKTYNDALASASPYLVEQLAYKKKSLDLENELAIAAIDKLMTEKQELRIYEDKFRQRQKDIDLAKQEALIREGWMKDGPLGGLKAGSVEREKESATRTAQWTIEAMKGVESYVGETGAQSFVDYLHGKKADLTKMFQDMGDSLIKQLFKMGTTKLFDKVWEGIGGILGTKDKGKPDGSEGHPFHVTFQGVGAKGITGAEGVKGAFPKATHAAMRDGFSDTESKMDKIGMTLGSSKQGGMDSVMGIKALEKEYTKYFNMRKKHEKTLDKAEDKDYKEDVKQLGGYAKLQKQFGKQEMKDSNAYLDIQDEMIEKNQELFKADYIDQYQTDFTGMATVITSIWGTAQGLMTTAGVSGDTQRLVSMAGYAVKGISLIMSVAKGSILADAYRGAAAAYAAMAGIPIIGPALGAVAAAVTFAAIAAFGAMGGVTSGIASGGSTMNSGNYTANPNVAGSGVSSAGGDYQVGMTGPRFVHQDETILPAWAAQSWRDIVSRENTGSRPRENGGGGPVNLSISIDARGAQKGIDWKKITKSEIAPQIQKLIKLNRVRT